MGCDVPLVRPRGQGFDTLAWCERGFLRILDQTRLPGEVVELTCSTVEEVARAIETLAVRGAPAIGIAAAYGLAIAASETEDLDELQAAAQRLRGTRPTAVNLFWAIDRVMARARQEAGRGGWAEAILEEAQAIHREDREMCEAMGRHGAALVPKGARILTHCNAGALATGGMGTALAVVRVAHGQGKVSMVYADETRPLMQGSRLTTWELMQDGIPVTLVCDDMAGFAMARGMIDMVITGADRIVANGDTANKIGTYTVASLAARHGIPMIVVAPSTTFDLTLPSGDHIPIEERAPMEVRAFGERATAPVDVPVWNPAFDVTPAGLITAIVTERGVARPPYRESLPALLGGSRTSQ